MPKRKAKEDICDSVRKKVSAAAATTSEVIPAPPIAKGIHSYTQISCQTNRGVNAYAPRRISPIRPDLIICNRLLYDGHVFVVGLPDNNLAFIYPPRVIIAGVATSTHLVRITNHEGKEVFSVPIELDQLSFLDAETKSNFNAPSQKNLVLQHAEIAINNNYLLVSFKCELFKQHFSIICVINLETRKYQLIHTGQKIKHVALLQSNQLIVCYHTAMKNGDLALINFNVKEKWARQVYIPFSTKLPYGTVLFAGWGVSQDPSTPNEQHDLIIQATTGAEVIFYWYRLTGVNTETPSIQLKKIVDRNKICPGILNAASTYNSFIFIKRNINTLSLMEFNFPTGALTEQAKDGSLVDLSREHSIPITEVEFNFTAPFLIIASSILAIPYQYPTNQERVSPLCPEDYVLCELHSVRSRVEHEEELLQRAEQQLDTAFPWELVRMITSYLRREARLIFTSPAEEEQVKNVDDVLSEVLPSNAMGIIHSYSTGGRLLFFPQPPTRIKSDLRIRGESSQSLSF